MPDTRISTINFLTIWAINLVALNAIMARQQCPQHSCTCNVRQLSDNRNATMTATTSLIHRDLSSLPYKAHPLFHLRKYTIIFAFIGLILSAAGTANYYYDAGGPVGFSIAMLIFSFLFCLLDLISYARKKASDPDNDPKWPSTKFMTCDFLLAGLLFVTFWCCIAYITVVIYWADNILLEAYGALALLVCSILHAVAFWKQYMARKKQGWLATLPQQPCARCGYTQIENEPTPQPQPQPHPVHASRSQAQPNVFPYAGPSAEFREANVLTPEQSESAMEEGLLIGSDFEGGYQTMSRDDDTTIDQPEGVVVVKGKGKGKKKAVARGDSGSSDDQGQRGSVGADTTS